MDDDLLRLCATPDDLWCSTKPVRMAHQWRQHRKSQARQPRHASQCHGEVLKVKIFIFNHRVRYKHKFSAKQNHGRNHS
jgi:hypothetical protein